MSSMFSSITGLFKKDGSKKAASSSNAGTPDASDNVDTRSETTAKTTSSAQKSPEVTATPTSQAKTLLPSPQEVQKGTHSVANGSRRGSAASDNISRSDAQSHKSTGSQGLLDFPAPTGGSGTTFQPRTGSFQPSPGAFKATATNFTRSQPPRDPKGHGFSGAVAKGHGFARAPMQQGQGFRHSGSGGMRQPSSNPAFKRSGSAADNADTWRNDARSWGTGNSAKSAGAGLLGEYQGPGKLQTAADRGTPVSTPGFRPGFVDRGMSKSSILGDAPDGRTSVSSVHTPIFNSAPNTGRAFRRSPSSLLGDGPGSHVSTRSEGAGLLGDSPTPVGRFSRGMVADMTPGQSHPRFQRSATGSSSILGASPIVGNGRPSGLMSSNTSVRSLADLAKQSSITGMTGPERGLSRGASMRSSMEFSPVRSSMADLGEHRESTRSILGSPPSNFVPFKDDPHPSRPRIGSQSPRQSLPSLEMLNELLEEEEARLQRSSQPHLTMPGMNGLGAAPLCAPPPPNSVASLSSLVHMRTSASHLPANILGSIPNAPPNSVASLSNIMGGSDPRMTGERQSYSGLNHLLPYDTGMPVVSENRVLTVDEHSSRAHSLDSRSNTLKDDKGPIGPDKSSIGFRMIRNNSPLVGVV